MVNLKFDDIYKICKLYSNNIIDKINNNLN